MNGIKISELKGKGWRKFVGGRMFYLGSDKAKATQLAAEIVKRWGDRKADGQWTEADLENIEWIKNEIQQGIHVTAEMMLEAMNLPDPKPQRAAGRISGTLYEALDRFAETRTGVSAAWKSEVAYRCGKFKQVAKDRPLTEFGNDTIELMIGKLIDRAKAGDYGKDTCLGFAATLHQFVEWLDGSDDPRWAEWVAPRKWAERLCNRKLLKGRLAGIKNPKRNAKRLEIGDLAKLYQAAGKRLQTLSLLALNCGYTSKDCATLTADMIVAHKGNFYICRDRQKTDVFRGGHLLWPETAEALFEEIKSSSRPSDQPIMLTEDGKPLTWHNGHRRIDSVGQAWNRLRAKVGLADMDEKTKAITVKKGCEKSSFKWLKKWAAQIIRNQFDNEIKEAWLGHSDSGGVQNVDGDDAYAGFENWAKVDEAINFLRQQVAPIFEPVKTS